MENLKRLDAVRKLRSNFKVLHVNVLLLTAQISAHSSIINHACVPLAAKEPRSSNGSPEPLLTTQLSKVLLFFMLIYHVAKQNRKAYILYFYSKYESLLFLQGSRVLSWVS